MATPGKADYHIHYYMDACAHSEMTLENIEKEAERLGLEEICVLKHFSNRLPNGQKQWVSWKTVVMEQFYGFLNEVRCYKQKTGIRIFRGVETELTSEDGEINIDRQYMDDLDSVSLSAHWIPDMKALKADPLLIPGNIGKISAEAAERWCGQVKEAGAAAVVEGYVSRYVKAMEGNRKIRVLAHMSDGLDLLRYYEIPVDDLEESRLLSLMEPLMKTCAEREVLWEIAEKPVRRESVLKRANELGVRFVATTDAHFLHAEGWSHLRDHPIIEEYLSSLGLKKGLISL